MPNKTTTGVPINFHYDPTLNNGSFYLWMAPGATEAANYTISIVANLPIADVDNSTDDFDFPSEWIEAVSYGLAYRMAPTTGLSHNERVLLKKDFDTALELALGWDNEFLSIRFAPEMR